MATIKISYKDTTKEYEKGISLNEILKDFKDNYKYDVLVGSINNKVTCLDSTVNKDSKINFYDITSMVGEKAYERGVLFLFCVAVKKLLNCDVKIICDYDDGMYCEILANNLISEVTIEKIKMKMRDIVDEEIPITKVMVSKSDAIDYYNRLGGRDKAESLRYISNSSINLYKLGDDLDYFYGVLPNNTKVLSKYALRYLKDNKVILSMPHGDNIDDYENYKITKNDKLTAIIEVTNNYLEGLEINNSAELNHMIAEGNYGDLIRISETLFNNSVLKLANDISKNNDVKIILITGTSSSGKSTISKKLETFLKMKGLEPVSISTTDFLLDGKVDDSIDSIDTSLFNDVISKLINKEETEIPKYNFLLGKRDNGYKLKLNDNGIIIIEGIYSFNEKLTEMVPNKHKYKVYASTFTPLAIDNHNMFKQEDVRLLRRIVRDKLLSAVPASVTLSKLDEIRNENKTIFKYIDDSDFIINTSLSYELSVLKTYVEPLLFSVNEDDKNYEEALRLINLFRVILGIPSEDVPKDSALREFIGGSCFKY